MEYAWLEPLLPRLTQLDTARLMRGGLPPDGQTGDGAPAAAGKQDGPSGEWTGARDSAARDDRESTVAAARERFRERQKRKRDEAAGRRATGDW